jgi:hypothetical protein
MPRAAVAIALFVAVFHAGTARADSNLIVGVGEDSLMGRGAETIAVARDLGLKAFRLTLPWEPGRTQLDPRIRTGLDHAVVAAAGTRIVLAVYGSSGLPPLEPAQRSQYCSYIRSALQQYPQINDVVIWNEPNLTFYWTPQFHPDGASAAPSAYHDLLAHCWDVLHAYREGVNLIGPVVSLWGNDNPDAFSNISHSPLNFIQKLGEAYRASGRSRPILDTFGHHPHPPSADERPWTQHEGVYVSIGDWGKLMNALAEAFEGTAQPLPGQGPSIWWLEVGFQTLIDSDKQHLYHSRENWRGPVPAFAGGEPDSPPPPQNSPAPDQATQLSDSVRLSFCQPYVEAFFNFLLTDEPNLTRWQSGVLWTDGSRKGSYDAFKNAIAEVNEGRVDCSRMKGGGPFINQVPGLAGQIPGVPGAPRNIAVAGPRGTTAWTIWDEWSPNPTGRPGAEATVPSGYFAQATPARLQYIGTQSGPFGFVTLRTRLTSDGRPVDGKEVSILAGPTTYTATTNADGVATVQASPPVPVGNWSVQASFLGDPEVRPAFAADRIQVVNTLGSVTSTGSLRLRVTKRASGSIRVSYNGRKLKGRVRLRAPGLDLRATRFTALGVGKQGRSAWFTGFLRRGSRFLAYAEDNGSLGRRDRFRLWVGDSTRTGEGRLRSGNVKITTR